MLADLLTSISALYNAGGGRSCERYYLAVRSNKMAFMLLPTVSKAGLFFSQSLLFVSCAPQFIFFFILFLCLKTDRLFHSKWTTSTSFLSWNSTHTALSSVWLSLVINWQLLLSQDTLKTYHMCPVSWVLVPNQEQLCVSTESGPGKIGSASEFLHSPLKLRNIYRNSLCVDTRHIHFTAQQYLISIND